MLQFKLERLLFGDGHWIADNQFASKFVDDRLILRSQQLFEKGTLFFALASDSQNVAFLGAIIERDVARHRAAAEDAYFAHPFRADPARGQVGDAAVGETE